MNIRESGRIRRINAIIESLKADGNLNEEDYLLNIMYDFGISRRTAREYITVAKSRIIMEVEQNGKNDKNDVCK